jgi:hypothetical protein
MNLQSLAKATDQMMMEIGSLLHHKPLVTVGGISKLKVEDCSEVGRMSREHFRQGGRR